MRAIKSEGREERKTEPRICHATYILLVSDGHWDTIPRINPIVEWSFCAKKKKIVKRDFNYIL